MASLVAADTFGCTWLHLNFATRHENECKKRTASRVRLVAFCSQQTESRWWKLWKACSVCAGGPSALMIVKKKKKARWGAGGLYLLHLALLLLNNLVQQGLEAVLWEKDKRMIREKRVDLPELLTSRCALWQSERTERQSDSWPFHRSCDHNN